MKLEIYADNLQASDVKDNKKEVICRGVVKHNDLFLIIEEESRSLYTLPGGKKEANETIEECVIREVLEETGVLVNDPHETITVIEYFPNITYISHYFTCSYENETNNQDLTTQEKDIGITVHWFNMNEALEYLSEHTSSFQYASTIQQREFLGFIHSI